MANSNFDIYSKIGKEAYVGEYFAILSSIRELKKGMTETLYSIIEASEQVEAGAEQLAGAAQDLSNGAIDQSSAVEELYATVTDIAEQVEKSHSSIFPKRYTSFNAPKYAILYSAHYENPVEDIKPNT